MRFGPFVETVMSRRMFNKHAEIKNFAKHIRGGWEVWAQIETASEVTATEPRFEFHREEPYPGGTQICDFMLSFDDAEDPRIWVELKVQLASGYRNLFDRFTGDYDKVHALIQSGVTFGKNDSGGVSALAISDSSKFISYAISKTPIAQQPRFRVCGFRPGNGQRYYGDLSDISKHGVADTDMVVLWSEMIGKSAEAEIRASSFEFDLSGNTGAGFAGVSG